MFRQIELSTYKVEAILNDYLVRGDLKPRGQFLIYMNDKNWSYIPFTDAELCPLAVDRRVGVMKKALTVVNKASLEVLAIVSEEEARDIQLPISKRGAIFYTKKFAIQGLLHVSSDAPDEDLLDEMHQYYPVSEAAIYPLAPIATVPTERVPVLFISRPLIQAYRVRQSG